VTDEEYRAIVVLSFRAAEDPDWEASYRKMCRWFSSKFAVPLPQVEEMAEEYVMRHYFEDIYCAIAESDSEDARKQWVEIRGKILQSYVPPEEVMSEEEFWQKALEKEFAADNAENIKAQKAAETADTTAPAQPQPAFKPRKRKQPQIRELPEASLPREKVVKTTTDKAGWTHQTPPPNLDTQAPPFPDIHIQGEDDPPKDE
jgi:hypothetical protein